MIVIRIQDGPIWPFTPAGTAALVTIVAGTLSLLVSASLLLTAIWF
jgi:hypothetical protein